MYILHPMFAESPEHYIRAFLILQRDLKSLFDFIEPDDTNLSTYSFRTHELLLRTCVEIEANWKAILKENGYSRPGDWNMHDYRRIDQSHHLSSYQVKVPLWRGEEAIRQPFQAWASSGVLPWYSAYNETKHNRHTAFRSATFGHVVDAMAALLVLMSAQFMFHDFAPTESGLGLNGTGPRDGMDSAIGDYFRVRFPDDWPTTERYAFRWQDLEEEEDPFREFPFS